MGTKFTVFDNALHPDRALPDMSNARQELAAIIYVRQHYHTAVVLVYALINGTISVIFHNVNLILHCGFRKQMFWA